MIRSYGSTLRRPGAGENSPEPSIGAHWTSLISIASRLFSASESRPSTCIRPRSRHSSVRPSNATPDRTFAAGLSPVVTSAGLPSRDRFLRRRKFSGTLLLGLEAVLPDRLDNSGVGERRRVAQLVALSDVAEQPPHDFARTSLGQIRREHQGLGLRNRADLRRNMLAQLLAQLGRGVVAEAKDDERVDRLATDRVGSTNDGRLGDGR